MAEVRPIDANAFSASLKAQSVEYLSEGNLSLAAVSGICAGLLNNEELAPTLDYAPVRHGEWVAMVFTDTGKSAGYKCSECGLGARKKFSYCHCGAKMDGGEHDDRPLKAGGAACTGLRVGRQVQRLQK